MLLQCSSMYMFNMCRLHNMFRLSPGILVSHLMVSRCKVTTDSSVTFDGLHANSNRIMDFGTDLARYVIDSGVLLTAFTDELFFARMSPTKN